MGRDDIRRYWKINKNYEYGNCANWPLWTACPHFPLAVDTIDCYEIAKRISAKTKVPIVTPLM